MTVAGLVFAAQVRRSGPYDERLLVVVAGTLVGGALGMRAAGLTRFVSEAGSGALAEAWRYGAKSVLGGLPAPTSAPSPASASPGTLRPTGDLFAPAVALGMGVGRLGCFFAEPLGRPTDVRGRCGGCTRRSSTRSPSTSWPSWSCSGSGAGWPPGALLTLYLAAYAGFRFLVELTRANEVLGLGLTGSQCPCSSPARSSPPSCGGRPCGRCRPERRRELRRRLAATATAAAAASTAAPPVRPEVDLGGVAVGIVATIGLSGLAVVAGSRLEVPGLRSVGFGVVVLAPLVTGITLAALEGPPAHRGFGLGLLIGWGLAPIVFAGVCTIIVIGAYAQLSLGAV